MGNRSDFPVEDGIQFFPQTNESLAQLLANHLQIKVHVPGGHFEFLPK